LVVSEAQRAPDPALDWQRIERHLDAQLVASHPGFVKPRRLIVIGLGVAAAAAFVVSVGVVADRTADPGVTLTVTAHEAPEAPSVGTGSQRIDGDRLPLGRQVTAGAAPVEVEHRGRARWTLEPQSRAHISVVGRYLTVRLEQGAIVARVQPSGSESFGVEVGKTRVAVKGTKFRVERRADDAEVEVSEGSVIVGSASQRGATQGVILKAPARGSFTLDAAVAPSSAIRSAQPAPVAAVQRSLHPVVRNRPSSPTEPAREPASAELPRKPSLGEVDRGIAQLEAFANTCLVEHTKNSGEVHVSVESMAEVRIAPNGHVEHVAFAPPLAPPVYQCVMARVSQVRFAPSQLGGTVARTLVLKH
jgi:hypothetical protein